MWKVDKSGLATRMLPGETVTEVKVSKGSERISAVTTKRSLYVSGSKAGSSVISDSTEGIGSGAGAGFHLAYAIPQLGQVPAMT